MHGQKFNFHSFVPFRLKLIENNICNNALNRFNLLNFTVFSLPSRSSACSSSSCEHIKVLMYQMQNDFQFVI